MIVELFGKRGDGGTSFKSLANYMASVRDEIDPDTGEVIDRRGVTTFTNCLSAETAWIEMWGSSAKSSRVEDPVFAGVVSWIPGETPTDEQVRDACLHVLKAEGLEGHQHLIAVHRDTDKVHGHFMANKVHWETGKAAELKWSKMKAVRAAREIEIEQGWQHVEQGPFVVREQGGEKVVDYRHASAKARLAEREAKGKNKPDQARKMEAFSHAESLASYVQGEPKKDALAALDKGGDWQALHKALAVHGLAIKPKGPGFAIHSTRAPDATPVKASTMAQSLGGARLKSRLGEYQEPTPEVARTEPRREYVKERPKRDPKVREEQRDARAFERAKLRSRYDSYRTGWNAAKAPARADMYEGQQRRRRELAAKAKAQRERIRESGLSPTERRAFYSVAAMQAAAERKELAEAIKAERAAFRSERPQDYRSWVGDRAQEGDLGAIRQVRGWAYADKRKVREMERADAVAGPHLAVSDGQVHDPAPPRRLSERVSWNVDRDTGTVAYQLDGREAFRDSGRRIDYTTEGQHDADAIEAGLLLAREKFGGTALNITGPDEFRQRVVAVAIERGLDVKFSDPELEQQRVEGVRARQEVRQRPDWTKHRGTVASDGRGPQRPPEAAQEPPRMSAEEATAALARPEPRLPNRELVELDAITAHGEAYRRLLDRAFRDQHGERPDPAQASGPVSRFMAKARAEQWDRDHAKIDQQVQERITHLRGDAPDAREFREQAWQQAESDHRQQHEAWSRDRWTAIQTTQEASMATPEQQRDDARARREAEARALADKQRKQAAEREQRQQKPSPDRDMEPDR
ncbi:TPA: relaxase/mobilization nuclease domain-containing protein [Escherichia coli]|nr:relaxase/mobilization nuclease domain-containing protein [Escherichia coli]HBB7752690.1 relaxase/mobilization nuclease domain-containing protein [Escherichia coli]HBB7832144.1 relaxase/mobilization nuclease domain-containing protein [Escherichia coli]HBB7860086.1 relaxase/mobilization nuclease domain-containing protein [Escherichia coli]